MTLDNFLSTIELILDTKEHNDPCTATIEVDNGRVEVMDYFDASSWKDSYNMMEEGDDAPLLIIRRGHYVRQISIDHISVIEMELC